MLIVVQSIIKNEINEAKLEEFSRFTKIYRKTPPKSSVPASQPSLTRRVLNYLSFSAKQDNGRSGRRRAVADRPRPARGGRR